MTQDVKKKKILMWVAAGELIIVLHQLQYIVIFLFLD